MSNILDTAGSVVEVLMLQLEVCFDSLSPVTAEQIHKLRHKWSECLPSKVHRLITIIAKPLLDVMNKCGWCFFPHSLKISRTVPIYKLADPNSYRPISVIPVFGSILESIMKQQLVETILRGMDLLLTPNTRFQEG